MKDCFRKNSLLTANLLSNSVKGCKENIILVFHAIQGRAETNAEAKQIKGGQMQSEPGYWSESNT